VISSTDAPEIFAIFAGSTAFQFLQTNAWTRSGKCWLTTGGRASPIGRTESSAMLPSVNPQKRMQTKLARQVLLGVAKEYFKVLNLPWNSKWPANHFG